MTFWMPFTRLPVAALMFSPEKLLMAVLVSTLFMSTIADPATQLVSGFRRIGFVDLMYGGGISPSVSVTVIFPLTFLETTNKSVRKIIPTPLILKKHGNSWKRRGSKGGSKWFKN